MQDCIDSIRAQNWANCEHIIIDGGSTDQTIDIIRQNEKWLTSFVSERDNGAADAINKGIRRSSGDIIAWLNADDFYLPGAFRTVADAFSNDPCASFWFGNGIRVDERGVEKAAFNSSSVRYDRRALIEGLDYILQPAAFINRQVLNEVGFLDASLRWSFDWDLWLRLGAHSQPSVIDAQLAASREWEETLTSNGGFRRAEELRLLAERHSGQEMTPGALCYWLDSMDSYMTKSSAAFSRDTSAALVQLWREVQKDMRQLNVDSSGNPLPEDAPPSLMESNGDTFDLKPLTIAVDLYPLIAGVSGGIVPWVQGVLRELARLFPKDRVVMFHRPGKPPLSVDAANVEYVPLGDHPVDFYAEMTRHCESIGVEAVIRTYPQEQHPNFPFTRQIFVIPDIQHEFFPEFFSKQVLAVRRRAFAYALSCGGAIATMTEHSRQTIIGNGWTLTDDVFLMPAALPEELREAASVSDLPAAAAAFQRYFYMPANLWPHKNHRRLFEAFKLASPHLPSGTGLVLSGNPEDLDGILKDFEDLPIVHLGFVPHRQVAALFSRATALVYFSLFEGFGMPLLEAFHHGTPVLCSNTTSLPEVGGDAVLSCDPKDIHAMAGLMQRITAEPGLRDILSEKAKSRVLDYTWSKPAQELRKALDRVAYNPIKYSEKKPLVSIVMPTRNHAHFIRQSIDSVLSQCYGNIELLVMDGASTDNTVEILREYGDRIRWISEPDKGQADAINKGMEILDGDVLAYLNSDDILLPGAVACAVRYFNDHPECDMVYGNADYIDVNGVVTGSYATAEYTFERLMHDCCVCQPAAFWRRRVVERIGPFDLSLQTAMDYEYWLRMATSGAILHHTIEKLAQSRLHEDAKTLAMRGKIFEEVFEICERHGGYVSFSYFLGLWSYRCYEAWRGGSAFRRIAPHAYKLAALAHFVGQMARIGMDRKKTAYVSRTLFGVVESRSPLMGKLARRMWANSATLRQRFR